MTMKAQHYLVAAGLLLVAAGCSTPAKRMTGRTQESLAAQARAIQQSLTNSAEHTSSWPQASWPAVIMVRSNALLRLEGDFYTERTRFSSRLIKLTGTAELFGISQAAVKWVGLASGITGAALSAASPANVVWVTALSGFAGAASGFGAAATTEGYSKAVVAAFLKPVVDEVVAANNGFSTARAQEYLWKEEGREFWEAIHTNSQLVNVIRGANIRLLQPPVVELKDPQTKNGD